MKKFGGATLADPEKIRAVAKRIHLEKINSGDQFVIVVSAMGKTTDTLLSQIKALSANPDPREVDLLLSTGELVSAALLSIALNELGCASTSLSGSQAGIRTDSHFSNAAIESIDGRRIEEALQGKKVVVLAGFQGSNHHGDITTLGRGGSDTTALAIAARLSAKRCEILKDVPAVYTADPRIVPGALPISILSYNALLEMTFWGAKVLQYRSVEIAKHFNVPLYIGPAHELALGTTIEETSMIEDTEVIGLNSHENVLQLHSKQPTLAKALTWLHQLIEEKHLPLPQILHSEHCADGISLFITGPSENMQMIREEVRWRAMHEPEALCSVTATCRGCSRPELIETLVSILEKSGIPVLSVVVSSMSISLFMKQNLRSKAILSLHSVLLKHAEQSERAISTLFPVTATH